MQEGYVAPSRENVWLAISGGSDGKNLPIMQGAWVQSLGQKYSLEKDMATHSSILIWRIPWTEEPGGLPSIGSQKVGCNWSDLAYHTQQQQAEEDELVTLSQSQILDFQKGCVGGWEESFPVSFALSCFSHVWLFATLRTVAWQVLLSMLFSRQKYWSGLPCPSLGNLPDPGNEPGSPTLQADS